jgi:hypothetical protein
MTWHQRLSFALLILLCALPLSVQPDDERQKGAPTRRLRRRRRPWKAYR